MSKLILNNKTKEIIGDTFLSNLSQKDFDKKLAEAYLGVLVNDSTLFNPLHVVPNVANDKFAEFVMYLMSQPEYFYFILKYIFQIDSFPQQCLILKELFNHRFPLLIASRGASKSFSLALYMLIRMMIVPETKCVITSAGFRQAKVVFDYMENIWKKSDMLKNCFKGANNGPKHGTDVWTFRLGDSITYALPVGPDGSKVRGYRANCVGENTLVQTDKGLVKIKDFINKRCSKVINIDGELEEPKSHYSTEPVDVYELVTENGYRLKFSELHQVYTPNGWVKCVDLKNEDLVHLDNNNYFPTNYVEHGSANILDENEIFYSGLMNLSTLASSEVPWYILQSPRKIVQKYLKLYFGNFWLDRSTVCQALAKAQHIQILLLKFGFISKIEKVKDTYKVTVLYQHLTDEKPVDKIVEITKLPEQESLYDFEIIGTNSFRGNGFINHNCLIAEEFASMNRQVFEEVMSGFLAVASSPVEQIKHTAKQNLMKQLSIRIPKSDGSTNFLQNQLILSGTAYYKINHFYSYFQKWHSIIDSKIDTKILKDMFSNDEDAKDINPDDYSIVRIPLELTANGYMDMAQIGRIKASTTKDVFLREYSAVFSDDSEGFFKKSLIDACTVSESDAEMFCPVLYGSKDKKYIYGVDPAYSGDNFAIVIVELHNNHRRVVYSWTTQSSDHKLKLQQGIVTEHDYYHYCARKIRDLMKRFPCEYIALDPQGGGNALMEAFRDITKLRDGESVILPIIDPTEKTKETDLMQGLHIIHIIKFTSEWISQANYGLKKDMEDKTIKFPIVDAISYAMAEYYDTSIATEGRELFDTLDDCLLDIEELKKELTTITVTETATGRERFDTPSIKMGINKKGRLRKDRYSALLMANSVARELSVEKSRVESAEMGSITSYMFDKNATKLFRGNSTIADQLNKLYAGY